MNVTLSDTLYHFTSQLTTLQAIITSNEYRLNLNDVQWTSPPDADGNFTHFQYRIPMVCFCETPYVFLQNHIRTFGNYGLGMKIEWAISHGIHNVIYADIMNPNLHASMITQLLRLFQNTPTPQRYPRSINDHLVGSIEPMIHRDEREWRFVGEVTNTTTYNFTPNSIPFTMDDVIEIICPITDSTALEAFLDANGQGQHKRKIKTHP